MNVCTYEMDDTPPFLVNQEAIDVAIELCLTMDMDIIDEVHIARKQYLDGSIPTGFQRTAIVGVNGWLPFKGRQLTITHVSVEEDSCREVKDKGHQIVWRTDRLGMPLTETVTGPELRTPEEVRDAILLCGLVARSTGRVRTGIGASRQDVNVSVRGGNRVRDQGRAARRLRREAGPQRGRPAVQPAEAPRGAAPPRAARRPTTIRIDAARRLATSSPTSTSGFMRRALAGRRQGLRREDRGRRRARPASRRSPTPRSSTSCRGRIRVIACLDEPPIVLSGARAAGVPRQAPRPRAAAQAAAAAARTTTSSSSSAPRRTAARPPRRSACASSTRPQGVPKETRQALAGGYTTFERILPGPDRMYPDTDSPPTRITAERVAEDPRAGCGRRPGSASSATRRGACPRRRPHFLIRRGGAEIVDAVVEKTGVDGLRRRHRDRPAGQGPASAPASRSSAWAPAEWVEVFDLFTDGRIPREAIRRWPRAMAAGRPRRRATPRGRRASRLEPREQWLPRARPPDAGRLPRREGRRRRRSGCASSPARRCATLQGKAPGQRGGRASARRSSRGGAPMSPIPLERAHRPLPGLPRPRAATLLERFGIGVWSEVEIDERPRLRASSASSCRAARPPTTSTSSSSSSTATTSASPPTASPRRKEIGYRKAVYKIPEKDFPFDPEEEERHAAGHRRHDRLPPRLPHRRGDPGLHARASSTARCPSWPTSPT